MMTLFSISSPCFKHKFQEKCCQISSNFLNFRLRDYENIHYKWLLSPSILPMFIGARIASYGPLTLPVLWQVSVLAWLFQVSTDYKNSDRKKPADFLIESYRFLRASYTAGSMAGLGFSMAILGKGPFIYCVSTFLGLLAPTPSPPLLM